MPTAHAKFVEYIGKCCKTLDLPAPTVDGDNYIFKVEDRWIELKQNSRGDLVTFVSLVYLAPPETDMRADLIASFNLRYLFDGGYALVAEPDEGRLYLVPVPPPCRPGPGTHPRRAARVRRNRGNGWHLVYSYQRRTAIIAAPRRP